MRGLTLCRWILVVLSSLPTVSSFCFQLGCSSAAKRPETPSLCQTQERNKHVVDGIECVEVVVDVESVGLITILEATADSQDDLVNMALLLENDDDDETSSQTTKHATGPSLCEGDPYGAVLWPAASAIASYMMNNLTTSPSTLLENCSVLELGAGTGLVSIAASLARAKSVLATDYETIPLKLLEYAARNLNPTTQTLLLLGGDQEQQQQQATASTTCTPIVTAQLDVCRYDTVPLPQADLVVAADVMYEPKTGRALARRALQVLKRGSRVLVGDSPGRAGRPAFLEELYSLGVKGDFVPVKGRTCSGERHELICGKESTSVSETPREMTVDILDLHPETCFR